MNNKRLKYIKRVTKAIEDIHEGISQIIDLSKETDDKELETVLATYSIVFSKTSLLLSTDLIKLYPSLLNKDKFDNIINPLKKRFRRI